MDVNETVLTFPHAFAAFGLFICECCVSDGRKRTNEKQCKRMTTRLTASNNGHLTNVYLAERKKYKFARQPNICCVVLFSACSSIFETISIARRSCFVDSKIPSHFTMNEWMWNACCFRSSVFFTQLIINQFHWV